VWVRWAVQYRSLAPMYYRGAAAAIIVYDITRVSTFDTLQVWGQGGGGGVVARLCMGRGMDDVAGLGLLMVPRGLCLVWCLRAAVLGEGATQSGPREHRDRPGGQQM
jgi:hypothetical protein